MSERDYLEGLRYEDKFPSTRVVHCKREPYDIYIGRGSAWGNPFVIVDGVRSRDEAISAYAEGIKTQPELLASLHKLKGKTLGCWCSPQACHGDVLARLADAT